MCDSLPSLLREHGRLGFETVVPPLLKVLLTLDISAQVLPRKFSTVYAIMLSSISFYKDFDFAELAIILCEV